MLTWTWGPDSQTLSIWSSSVQTAWRSQSLKRSRPPLLSRRRNPRSDLLCQRSPSSRKAARQQRLPQPPRHLSPQRPSSQIRMKSLQALLTKKRMSLQARPRQPRLRKRTSKRQRQRTSKSAKRVESCQNSFRRRKTRVRQRRKVLLRLPL